MSRQPVMTPIMSRAASIAADPWLGRTLDGKWRIERRLGIGGMAVVYAATHRNGSRVAIKLMHAHVARDPEIVERFAKEGHVGNLVDHPGAVRTLDDGVTDEGVPYLVMEMLDGETLERRLGRVGALPAAEAIDILARVLDTLAAAHGCGLVHRDVKPDNVFLMEAGGVKLLDFGIAHERVLEMRGISGLRRQTVIGTVLGTPSFMSPEQARGRCDEVDERSDVWAAGATFFMALTGRPLREGETSAEELLAAMHPTMAMRFIAPEIPAPLAAILDRALAYNRASRFPSAAAMRAALLAVPFGAGRVALAPSGSPSRRVLVAVAGLCVAGAIGIASLAAAMVPQGQPRAHRSFLPAPPLPAVSQIDAPLPSVPDIVVEPDPPPPARAQVAVARPIDPPRPAPPRAPPAPKPTFDPMAGRF